MIHKHTHSQTLATANVPLVSTHKRTNAQQITHNQFFTTFPKQNKKNTQWKSFTYFF